MIDQLIEQIASKVGLDAGTARKAVGVVLGLINKEGDASAVSDLFGKIPGAADLAGEFKGGVGGGMGGLLSKVSGMLGGGSALSAMAALKQAGVSMDQAKDMMPVVKGFLSENAGEDIASKALGSVPALKDLLG